MLSAFVRLFYPFGSKRRVVFGPLRGMYFRVRPAMGFTYAVGAKAYGFDWFWQNIALGMTVFDIGANRGQMALMFSRIVGDGGRVIAFEPMTQLINDLKSNLALNHLENVVPVVVAVSDQNGEALFSYTEEASTQGKLVDCESSYIGTADKKVVQTVTLDDYVDQSGYKPDFLKIDTEGAAGLVFSGARKVIAQYRPKIHIELHGPDEQNAVFELARDHHYQIYTLSGDPIDDPRDKWCSPLVCEP